MKKRLNALTFGIVLVSIILALAVISAQQGNQGGNGNGNSVGALVGNDSDSHGCKPSAGYSWCASLQECIRPWETNCSYGKEVRAQIKEQIQALKGNITQLKQQLKLKIHGENITIDEIDNETLQIITDKINAKTGLNLTTDQVLNGTALYAWLSNGERSEIKIMPGTASERAIERLRLKVCNESNNCTIMLKEVGVGNQTRVAYEISTQENSRVLFLFKNKMILKAQVDAETGDVISVKKPWWSFLTKTD